MVEGVRSAGRYRGLGPSFVLHPLSVPSLSLALPLDLPPHASPSGPPSALSTWLASGKVRRKGRGGGRPFGCVTGRGAVPTPSLGA